MATASDGSGSGSGGEQRRLLSIPKEGERIIAPTRRPDGTLRKAIRIRAGYVPQEEVAIYQSKGAQMRKSGPDVPPGYDPALDAKPKTKAAKRNERRKEKRQQAGSTNDKGKSLHIEDDAGEADNPKDAVDSVTKQISGIAISESPVVATSSADATNNSKLQPTGPDIDKKIRALKKKIRLAEAQLQGDPEKLKPEQLEKMKKIEAWQEELKLLGESSPGAS
ncbi:partner of Y14 and mago isoform X2 [Oryza brachyantha]|uniref:WIBG Mago-binding domain-containing protein n=1 Tax=Oryza brachyantha TaxID=4533 RepID=J3LM81_ORYBR|nr:partner of Y14 and mago isoform X2 [Oryza brachyantha]